MYITYIIITYLVGSVFSSSDDLEKLEPNVNIENQETVHIIENLEVLNHDNFEEETKTGHVFIMFSAPKCNKCRELETLLDSLAIKYKSKFYNSLVLLIMFFCPAKSRLRFGLFDCTDTDDAKILCLKMKVRGFPALILFRYGQVVDQVKGDVELEKIIKFLEETVDDFKVTLVNNTVKIEL